MNREAVRGLTNAEAMDAIFERFFNRSPEHGYSFAEFKADALIILESAEAQRVQLRAERIELRDALDGATDVAGHFIRKYGLANTSGEKHAVRKASRNAALNVIALARAALASQTREEGT